jgi:hypothetical protein
MNGARNGSACLLQDSQLDLQNLKPTSYILEPDIPNTAAEGCRLYASTQTERKASTDRGVMYALDNQIRNQRVYI